MQFREANADSNKSCFENPAAEVKGEAGEAAVILTELGLAKSKTKRVSRGANMKRTDERRQIRRMDKLFCLIRRMRLTNSN